MFNGCPGTIAKVLLPEQVALSTLIWNKVPKVGLRAMVGIPTLSKLGVVPASEKSR